MPHERRQRSHWPYATTAVAEQPAGDNDRLNQLLAVVGLRVMNDE